MNSPFLLVHILRNIQSFLGLAKDLPRSGRVNRLWNVTAVETWRECVTKAKYRVRARIITRRGRDSLIKWCKTCGLSCDQKPAPELAVMVHIRRKGGWWPFTDANATISNDDLRKIERETFD